MNIAGKIALIMVGVAVFAGCEPEKISVTVPVSSIEKVKAGKCVYLKAKANGSSSFVPDDIVEKREKISSVMAEYLGKGGRVTMKEANDGGLITTAQWKIPFYRADVAPADVHLYPLSLVYSPKQDGVWLRSNKERIKAMNDSLNSIDMMMSKVSEFGMTDITFENDTEASFSYKVYGAFVDGDSKIAWTMEVKSGDESTVSFGRASADSIWHSTDPYVGLPASN